ncbi:MAG: isoleucine--tRNA ligase [Gemmatimonadales bacterium]
MTTTARAEPAAVAPAPYALLPATAEALETQILAQWRTEHLFARSLAASEGRPEFVFYEGPPTANGLPGTHHVFSRTVKDLFCRHRAMRGYHVARKAGWDTHGLPVEIEVEKSLGITAKAQIEAYGVDRFNALCRESVWKYREVWERMSERIGYWLDFRDPYVTYEAPFIESVWWALATLWKRGFLYEGHKVLPYCPRCETALSSHELALGYRDVEDPSVYVALDLLGGGRRVLVWTTTPWTLVSNVALAVHPDLEYVEVKPRAGDDKRTLILAESRVAAVLGDHAADQWETVRTLRGSELAGLRYQRPLDWVSFPVDAGDHEIIVAETFVSADEGSGVVHMAPAFGADDYAAGRRHGLAFLQPLTSRGAFVPGTPVVGGEFVKDADRAIIDHLRRAGVVWSAQRVTHSYPHCWRCGTPLLYFARSSWFVRTTAYRDEMLARNARIGWHPPETGSGRFGEWLAGNIDWAISRDRFWGTPLPVWVCDADAAHREIIGSFAELAERTGAPLPPDFDPHKPGVDRYHWSCAACTAAGRQPPGTMRRVAEVIDAWFDSGSVPFAQWHYPFEHRAQLGRQYPADFVAEGIDQTRGWFYSMLAIATGLGDELPNNEPGHAAPYRNVVVNDLVLDAQGQKMSKSRGNSVDPWRIIETYGADTVRLFLISTSQVWVPRRFDEQAIQESSRFLWRTLKETYNGMFATLANYGWTPSPHDPAPGERPPLDRWVLSRLATIERDADALFERYEPTLAIRAVMQFIDEDVSNWYVRLTRGRRYAVGSSDSRAAFATLHEVLAVGSRLLAPIAPFVTDWLHRQLTGTSVHLASYVRPGGEAAIDGRLERAMDALRTLATLARAARATAKIKTRQPLSRLVCVVPSTGDAAPDAGLLAELAPLLQTELNVKEISWVSSEDALVTLSAKGNYRTLGKKFGTRTPLAAQAIARLSSDDLRAFERGGALSVTVDGDTQSLDREDVKIEHAAAGELLVEKREGFVAALDPRITPALAEEGLAREVISAVQRTRKEAGFSLSDRIRLVVDAGPPVAAAVQTHRDWIAREVLAHDITVGGTSLPPDGFANRVAGAGPNTGGGTDGGSHDAGRRTEGTPKLTAGFDAVRTLDLDGLRVRIALTRELES